MKTNFSGPVHSDNGFENSDMVLGFNGFCTVTEMDNTSVYVATGLAAALADNDNAYNTTNKHVGRTLIDGATGIIYLATGVTATSAWVGSNASTITPA
jgi:hypothetical protein